MHLLQLANSPQLTSQRGEKAVGPVLDVVVREHLEQRVVPLRAERLTTADIWRRYALPRR